MKEGKFHYFILLVSAPVVPYRVKAGVLLRDLGCDGTCKGFVRSSFPNTAQGGPKPQQLRRIQYTTKDI